MAGKDVYVVGGGNSAGQAALHLARYARHVTILARAHSLDASMSRYLIRAVEAAPKVEVRTRVTVTGGGGAQRLERLELHDAATGRDETVPADGLFVLIGAHPLTDWLPPAMARDTHGLPPDRRRPRRRRGASSGRRTHSRRASPGSSQPATPATAR